MIGTYHLGDADDPAAEIELALDGRVVDRWTLSPAERNSLRFLDLPATTGEGDYARLTVSSRSAAGMRAEHRWLYVSSTPRTRRD